MSVAAAASLRVIRSPATAPAANMALDAALLEASDGIALRLYSWHPPGLSLGWFQDPTPFRTVPGTHRMVRRMTGGGAIYHADELTFALTGPTAALGDTESLYVRVHDALVRALASVGVRGRRIEGGPAGPGPNALRSAWCFEHPARHDVIAPDGRKLAGSAQRRVQKPRARVLHHGSIPLRRPDATPFCAAVADQVDPDRVREDLAAALITELSTALGLTAHADSPTAEEADRASELATRFTLTDDPACPSPMSS